MRVFDILVDTTDTCGAFSIPGVPTQLGDIVAVARIVIGPDQFGGKSFHIPPVPGGTTDVGFIEIETSGPIAQWICADGDWSNTFCWVGLKGADPYPNNGAFVYNVALPQSTGPYTMVKNVGVTIDNLDIHVNGGLDLSSGTLTATAVANDGTLFTALGSSATLASSLLTNNGLVDCRNGSSIALSGNLLNTGTITTDGGTLTLSPQGSFDSSAGLIQATNGGRINLRGTFSTVAGLGTIDVADSRVEFGGALNDVGTWSIGPEYGSFTIAPNARLTNVTVETP